MCIKNLIKKLSKKQEEPIHPMTVGEMIEEHIHSYNKDIEVFANKYMERFYDEWRKSIHRIHARSIKDIKDYTFAVEDCYSFRPKESWELFLDKVLSNHPDMLWSEKPSKIKPEGEVYQRPMYIFDYSNCLNDTLNGTQD